MPPPHSEGWERGPFNLLLLSVFVDYAKDFLALAAVFVGWPLCIWTFDFPCVLVSLDLYCHLDHVTIVVRMLIVLQVEVLENRVVDLYLLWSILGSSLWWFEENFLFLQVEAPVDWLAPCILTEVAVWLLSLCLCFQKLHRVLRFHPGWD